MERITVPKVAGPIGEEIHSNSGGLRLGLAKPSPSWDPQKPSEELWFTSFLRKG